MAPFERDGFDPEFDDGEDDGGVAYEVVKVYRRRRRVRQRHGHGSADADAAPHPPYPPLPPYPPYPPYVIVTPGGGPYSCPCAPSGGSPPGDPALMRSLGFAHVPAVATPGAADPQPDRPQPPVPAGDVPRPAAGTAPEAVGLDPFVMILELADEAARGRERE
ncbi:hypothetical protein GCM10010278_76280 [Streptomyces melanogenes]|nr:hypothetical protein GCM10010278_76280 [Streptomyces melanogenes]